MANEWLTDARKIPDEVMSYIRKLAVRAVVEFGWSPECVYAVFGLSRSSLYDWLDKWRRGQGLTHKSENVHKNSYI